ncbi:E3 ubiquitin-protein ligase RNF25, partial [Heterodontus francisci]|uniref:E3 ubiquitin-protein ligase RNF25 n=1 Tax=Heterodontus francisci TaxID=7792 RepID=UPI00355C5CC5
EGEAFTKTACYHYLHSYCLAQYIRHSEAEFLAEQQEHQLSKLPEHELKLAVLCPVCREPLTYDLGLLLAAAAPNRPLPVTSQSPEEEEERGERPGNRSPTATASDPERAPAPTEDPCPRRGGRAGSRGWAGARPRPLADRREGAPPQELHRLAAGPDPAARDGGSPARGRRTAGGPGRGLPDRREAAPRAQQRRPCPRRDWSEGRGRWRSGGRGQARQAEAWGPGEVSSLEPGPR